MTDVMKFALERRAALNEEVEKLDDFIRMAESLIRESQHKAVPEMTDEMPRRPAQVADPVVRTAIRRTDESEDNAVQRANVIRRTSSNTIAASG